MVKIRRITSLLLMSAFRRIHEDFAPVWCHRPQVPEISTGHFRFGPKECGCVEFGLIRCIPRLSRNGVSVADG